MPAEGDAGASRTGHIAREQTDSFPTQVKNNGANVTENGAHQPTGFGQWLRSLLGLGEPEGSFKEALQDVLEEHAGDLKSLPPEERRMFSNLLEFGELEVNDIMTPEPDIIAVDISADLQELKQKLVQELHTRMPVYDDSIDNVQGFIHVKDLVPFLGTNVEGFQVKDILREILFVPPSMKVVDLLMKMRMAGTHIAIVVDEYGGTKGLVTLEDLFEEIVGDIQDEHDDEELMELSWDSKGSILLDAKVRVEDIQEQLGLALVNEEGGDGYDTLGGCIFDMLGRVPSRGEEIIHPAGALIEVLDVDARRIKKVRLQRLSSCNGASNDYAVGNK